MRFISTRFPALLCLALVLVASSLFAQNTSEDDVKKQAQKYFDAGDFTSALPLYSQLLSFYAKDPTYNYRYGVCALEAGNNREKPIAYLEFASKNKDVNNNVFFYLGKAYHLNYRFASALNSYNTYKIKALKVDQDKFQVDRQLDMCRNGMELLKNINDLTVMEKKELALSDYFRAYDLTSVGLKLLVKPDDFKTDLDKKRKEESVIVLNPNKSEIYFSSYGENDRNGKDIYKVKRMDNGDWSNPIRLDNIINTAYDEDFPFLSNDGTTLYFCSKGHTSMGGYDVFKSTYNPALATWSVPENLDFAINTPDDDLLYIADDVNKVAYFSSRRTSGQGNINVYKIKVGPKPPSIALISGIFSTIDENTHPEATITVRDSQTKNIIGVYKSDPKTGNYSIPLPSSGTYIFNVESEVSAMKTATVIVPDKRDLGTLQQKINVKGDQLSVENIFEDAAINEANLMALLKAKANLDVNYVAEAKPPVEEPKVNNLSNQDLVNIAYQDAKDTRAEADQLQLKADQAFALSKSKIDLSKANLTNAEVLEKNAQLIASPQQKMAEMEKANQLKRGAKSNTLQAYAIYTIAKNLEEDANIKRAEADQSLNYAKELDNAIQINSKESIARLTTQKNNIQETAPLKSTAEEASGELTEQAENKQQEADAANSRSKIVLTEILDIDLKAETLLKDKAVATDERTIQDLNNQIEELRIQKEEKQKQLEQNNATANQFQQEADDLKSQSEFISIAMNDLKSASKTLPIPTPQEKISLGNELAIDLGRANTIAKVDPVLQANNTDINDGAADAFITTDIGKSPVTAANFNAKMAQANKISDPVKREEQRNVVRSQMNANWDKDIADLKIQQANSKDKNERADMQSRITELENLKAMNTPTPEIALTTAAAKNIETAQEAKSKATADSSVITMNSVPISSTAANETNKNSSKATDINSTPVKETTAPVVGPAVSVSQDAVIVAATVAAENDNKLVENQPAKVDIAASAKVNSDTAANTVAPVLVATAPNTLNENKAETSEPLAASTEIVDIDKLEEDYDQQFALVNQIQEPNQRAKANQKLAESWTKVSDDKIAATNAQRAKATNSEEIATLNTTLDELQILKNKINSANETPAIAANTASSSSAPAKPLESEISASSTTANSSLPSENTFVGAALKNEKERNPVIENNFTTEMARTQARKADKLNVQAAQLKGEEDSLTKILITTTDSVEKKNVEQLVVAKQKEVYVKKIEALKAYSVANNVEFNDNTLKLKNISDNAKGLDTDNLSRAEMLIAEAAYYYNEATIKSELNTSITDAELKETELKKIVELEKIAIEKQQRAITTYGIPVGVASVDSASKTSSLSSAPIVASNASSNVSNDESTIEKTSTTPIVQPISANETVAQPAIEASVPATIVAAEQVLVENKIATPETAASEKIQVENNASAPLVTASENAKIQPESAPSVEPIATAPLSKIATELVAAQEGAYVFPTDTMTTTLKLSQVEADSVRISPYYNYYNGLLIATTESLQESSYYLGKAEELDEKSLTDSLQAEDLIIQASKATDTLKMQELIGKAAESTFNSNRKKLSADSSYSVARRLIATSVENRENASRYISRLSDLERNKLISVMNPRALPTFVKPTPKGKILASNQKPASISTSANSKSDVEINSTPLAANKSDKQVEVKEENAVPANQLVVNNQDLAPSETVAKNTSAVSDFVNERNELVNETVFTKVNRAVYNKSNPIPINALLPNGIIFKVQIGAFKKPIPQDLFKGFDPISGETSAAGITRYTAGYFKNFEAANSAKKEINGIGYKDAFVVAFCNGKRISIPEATAMIREGKTCAGELIAASTPAPIKTEKPVESTTFAQNALRIEQNNAKKEQEEKLLSETNPTTKDVKQNDVKQSEGASSQSSPIDVKENPIVEAPSGPVAPSVSFEEVKGLVYTVQVGVYSKQILANQLFNIQPLYFERTATGLYRYTSGIFDNIETATQAKANIIGIGVKDAFVTTYYNGARIPVEQAKQLEVELGKAVFATSDKLNKMPETNSNAKITGLNAAVPNVRIEKQNKVAVNESEPKSIALPVGGIKNKVSNAIVFKVQIGVFRSEIPIEIAAIFLKLSNRGIENYQTSDSLNIYTIGNLRDIKSATILKDEVIQEGLPDAFIVAFKGGVKMKLEDAIQETTKK